MLKRNDNNSANRNRGAFYSKLEKNKVENNFNEIEPVNKN